MFAQGITEHIAFCCSEEDLRTFRALSGDDNPLHDDTSFARAHGFRGCVVYGGLIVAQISRLLGTRLPGAGCVWRSLSLRFRNPLYAGDPAVLTARVTHANEELGLMSLALQVTACGRTVAEGEATAQLMPARSHAHG